MVLAGFYLIWNINVIQWNINLLRQPFSAEADKISRLFSDNFALFEQRGRKAKLLTKSS